jgi:hypothetical protein
MRSVPGPIRFVGRSVTRLPCGFHVFRGDRVKAVRIGGMFVLGAASLVSCSDGGEESVGTAQVPGRELSAEVADRLIWTAPRVPPEMAATGDEILVVGGLDVVESDGLLRLPDSALLVDTAADTVTEVPTPRSDTSVHVVDAAADASGFVVAGLRCDDAGFSVGEYECLPGSGASFRLDTDSASWRELSLPAEVTPANPDEPWVFQPELGLAPDGRVFMVVRAGPTGASGPLPFRLLYLDGDRWLHGAELSTDLVVDACAAADGVYVLSSLPGETVVEGSPPPATLRLVRTGLDGGALAPVDLPDIDTSIGGAAVAMACDKTGPYVTSSRPDPSADLALYALRGEAWTQIDGDWGNAIPLEVASAAEGVALVNLTPAGSGRTAQAFTVSASSGTAAALGGDSGLRRFEPDPTTGGFVAVGPLPDLAADAGAPDSPRSAPMSALTIEP